MTSIRSYHGLPVSDGVAAGQIYRGSGQAPGQAASATADEVKAAFDAVAAERSALAQRLRDEGRDEEAGIVGIGALLAGDPTLVGPAVTAVGDGVDAATAVERSAATQAGIIAALDDPDLAARADDIRQVASAVLARLAGVQAAPPPPGRFILVQREVDPADLIRWAEAGLAGAVSVSGGANSHAAIIARGLGLPMLAGADPEVLDFPEGRPALLDGTNGCLTLDPSPSELAAAGLVPAAPANGGPGHAGAGHQGAGPERGAPLRTADGQEITLLCNVASATEVRTGLTAGAAGAGLLRTEIPFLRATRWPAEADHLAALGPVLKLLAGRRAVVRLLDFSGDKIPPFLADEGKPAGEAGLTALLRHPRALGDQLRAVLASGQDTLLRVMVPMVTSLDEIAEVRAALADAAAATGAGVPELGMMVEVAATAAAAHAFAPAVSFFSIGTNDLTSEVFDLGRGDGRLRPALAADPRVLALIDAVVRAAQAAGIPVSVCGDAAADPAVLPLLVGLGVRTLSVGAARVRPVADWISRANAAACADQAAQALDAAARTSS